MACNLACALLLTSMHAYPRMTFAEPQKLALLTQLSRECAGQQSPTGTADNPVTRQPADHRYRLQLPALAVTSCHWRSLHLLGRC
jgi:hypothetical protein